MTHLIREATRRELDTKAAGRMSHKRHDASFSSSHSGEWSIVPSSVRMDARMVLLVHTSDEPVARVTLAAYRVMARNVEQLSRRLAELEAREAARDCEIPRTAVDWVKVQVAAEATSADLGWPIEWTAEAPASMMRGLTDKDHIDEVSVREVDFYAALAPRLDLATFRAVQFVFGVKGED